MVEDCGPQFLVKELGLVEFVDGRSSYGFRENPKKTLTAVDSSSLCHRRKFANNVAKGFNR